MSRCTGLHYAGKHDISIDIRATDPCLSTELRSYKPEFTINLTLSYSRPVQFNETYICMYQNFFPAGFSPCFGLLAGVPSGGKFWLPAADASAWSSPTVVPKKLFGMQRFRWGHMYMRYVTREFPHSDRRQWVCFHFFWWILWSTKDVSDKENK